MTNLHGHRLTAAEDVHLRDFSYVIMKKGSSPLKPFKIEPMYDHMPHVRHLPPMQAEVDEMHDTYITDEDIANIKEMVREDVYPDSKSDEEVEYLKELVRRMEEEGVETADEYNAMMLSDNQQDQDYTIGEQFGEQVKAEHGGDDGISDDVVDGIPQVVSEWARILTPINKHKRHVQMVRSSSPSVCVYIRV